MVDRACQLYGDGIAAGQVPSIRAIKRDLHVGSDRASVIKAALTAVSPTMDRAA